MKGFAAARKVLVLISLFLFVLNANAFGGELDELKKEVEKQKSVIEQLEKRIEEIEARGEKVKVEESERHEILPLFGMNLGAFGDIDLSSQSREKTNGSFALGSLSLYSTANVGERLNFLFEMEVESSNAKGATDMETHVDIERLWAGYTFNDFLIVRAGRFHTPLGWWNTAYHHGKVFFPSVDRPFFLQFEDFDGVIPVHLVGAEASGAVASSAGRFKYDFEVGNGPRMVEEGGKNVLTPNDFADDNNSKQVALRLSFEPRWMPGVSAGVFGTNFKIEDPTGAVNLYESIYGFYLYGKRDPVEFTTEYFRFRNETDEANAYYIQFAYMLEGITPFIRYETLDGGKDDPYMNALSGGGDRFQYIAGVKYDLDIIRSALKAQYRYDEKKGEKTYNVLEMQWAFHF
ncbi:MAG: hypothetical protein HY883_05210 [Deltaproteobacteria bacterium]|nr:hypothetical protein [Deltaproteobacteria bacterium]